jgi:hypothetical protein
MVKLQAFQHLVLVEATQPTTQPRVMQVLLVVHREMEMVAEMVAVLEPQVALLRLTIAVPEVVVVQAELEMA